MKRAYIVLGGCGAMGRIAVRDLFATDRRARITIADLDGARARDAARALGGRRVSGVRADASDAADLAHLLRGHDVVINCTQHHFNLSVMRAALSARCDYVDLGGLFTWTRRQLRLNAEFRRAGRTAVPGMGGSPGITNVLARWAADRLTRVDAVRVRSCWHDPDAVAGDFSFAFSPQTVMEELTLTAYEWRGGRFIQHQPRCRWERRRFPAPFGTVWCLATRHSEVATLPASLGARRVDFMLGYERGFVREFERRWKAGWRLREFKPLVASRARARDLELLRVEVDGLERGALRRVQVTADCIARAKPSWRASAGDVDTGCPPSIVGQMLARGELSARGVCPPETLVPVAPFIRALRARGMRVQRRVKAL
jgi:saccharopine dehydrogenase-like NADP-dependent oxidoreductase